MNLNYIYLFTVAVIFGGVCCSMLTYCIMSFNHKEAMAKLKASYEGVPSDRYVIPTRVPTIMSKELTRQGLVVDESKIEVRFRNLEVDLGWLVNRLGKPTVDEIIMSALGKNGPTTHTNKLYLLRWLNNDQILADKIQHVSLWVHGEGEVKIHAHPDAENKFNVYINSFQNQSSVA